MKKQKQLAASPNQITKTPPEHKLMRKYTPEETRAKVLDLFRSEGDLDFALKELGSEILPKLLHGNKTEEKDVRKTLSGKITTVMMGLEADSHWALKGAFPVQYWGMAKELASQVIKEYDCSTHAEKMLVEIMVNAFIRTIDASKELTEGRIAPGGSITENRSKYLAVLSKEHDRANRQFLNSLMTLKQLKAPTIEMNIRTKNTFVAQNQQINANGLAEPTSTESNEAK